MAALAPKAEMQHARTHHGDCALEELSAKSPRWQDAVAHFVGARNVVHGTTHVRSHERRRMETGPAADQSHCSMYSSLKRYQQIQTPSPHHLRPIIYRIQPLTLNAPQ